MMETETKSAPAPWTPEDRERAGAFEWAEAIRDRRISVRESVEHFISQIQKWNPHLNGLVEDCFAQAREQASACDEALARGRAPQPLPPLYGVPFTTKEMIAVEGLKHTLGSTHRREDRREEDATVVARLRGAGAILLGTTNVPELGFWFESSNAIYGRTNNPYDLTRTCGGSTGGEAALIGAGASLFGLGSDIGGSIRLPAGFCGIYGHKPSGKLVPLTGHFPVYPENASTWRGARYPLAVLGPLARRARDLYPLLQILAGPDDRDPEVTGQKKLKPRVTTWENKTVWLLESPRIRGAALPEAHVSEAARNAARYFEAMGAQLKIMKSDVFAEGLLLWFAALSRGRDRSFTEILSGGEELSYLKEYTQLLLGRGRYTLPALTASWLEVFSKKKQSSLEPARLRNLEKVDALKAQMARLLGEDAILVMPTHPRAAPPHGAPTFRPFDFIYTGVINALELPATACPVGLNDEGLPLSVQIVAGPDQDHLTLSAAESLEQAFGGWRAPGFPPPHAREN